MNPKEIIIWVLVALVGAVSWGVIALVRGEEISAAWLVFAALASYAIAYRFYARFLTNRVLKTDDDRATPAERLNNGADFHPTDRFPIRTGGYFTGEVLADGSWRFAGGMAGAIWMMGCRVGLAYRTETATFASSLGDS